MEIYNEESPLLLLPKKNIQRTRIKQLSQLWPPFSHFLPLGPAELSPCTDPLDSKGLSGGILLSRGILLSEVNLLEAPISLELETVELELPGTVASSPVVDDPAVRDELAGREGRVEELSSVPALMVDDGVAFLLPLKLSASLVLPSAALLMTLDDLSSGRFSPPMAELVTLSATDVGAVVPVTDATVELVLLVVVESEAPFTGAELMSVSTTGLTLEELSLSIGVLEPREPVVSLPVESGESSFGEAGKAVSTEPGALATRVPCLLASATRGESEGPN
jgi:hypothetical protein